MPYCVAWLQSIDPDCALRDVPRAQQPASIPEFVATWGIMPLSEWCVKLDVPAGLLTKDERLLDPDYE